MRSLLSILALLSACGDPDQCVMPPHDVTLEGEFSAFDELHLMSAIERYNRCYGDGSVEYVRTSLPTDLNAEHDAEYYFWWLIAQDYECVDTNHACEAD